MKFGSLVWQMAVFLNLDGLKHIAKRLFALIDLCTQCSVAHQLVQI